jgi:murein DD-endopeptidase MepM/ murein hydrolase activator NlpD
VRKPLIPSDGRTTNPQRCFAGNLRGPGETACGIRCVVAFLAFLLLCLSLPGNFCFAETESLAELERRIGVEEKRLEIIQRQLDFHQRKIKETAGKERDLLAELGKLTEDIGVAQQKISVLQLKQSRVQERLNQLNTQIEATVTRLETIRKLLRERVVALYKYGGMVELDLLFAASSTHEAMTTAYLLNRMTEEDKRLFEEAAARKKLLDTSREEVLRQKEILAAQRAAAEQERKRLAAAVKKRNEFLQDVRASKGSLEAAAKDLAREQQEIEQVIRRLLVERQRLAEKKRREEAERTGRTDTLLVRPSGPLSWPHRGQITSSFGIRQHPIFRTRIMHTGIDIDGRDGDPVQAAAAGEVLYAGWLKGYGQVIILDHGGDLSTVYAHLSRMHVEEGARVTKGQVIGRVGSTGVATGSHLHFEVRVNGEAKNPMRYLGR